jgi:phosphinothricin acetyltransferase
MYGTPMVTIRPGVLEDLPALTEIYNHYIVHTPVTFDINPVTAQQRRPWFDDHAGGRHLLLVATDNDVIVGCATSSRWRPKAAYDTTVECSVYCHPEHVGRGIGTRLYEALFARLAGEDVHRIVAGVTLPNPASLALHERFGFRRVGEFTEVGRKFGRYWDVAWFERAVGDRNSTPPVSAEQPLP